LNQKTAFAPAEGILHAFLIVDIVHRRDTPGMTPSWFVRFNDFLPWLNPVLGLIAGVLTAMVIASAAGRLPVQPTKPIALAARAAQQPAPVACQKVTLPPEWRELARYD